MAYSHFKIQELVTDNDGDGNPRIRLKVEEYKARTLMINLKNADAAKIHQLQKLVGGSAMVPVREGMMNGQTFLQLLIDDEIMPINQPEKILVAKMVELNPSDQKAVKS